MGNVCGNHGCLNLVGSYRCECRLGFIFNSITKLCEGKAAIYSYLYVWIIIIFAQKHLGENVFTVTLVLTEAVMSR